MQAIMKYGDEAINSKQDYRLNRIYHLYSSKQDKAFILLHTDPR